MSVWHPRRSQTVWKAEGRPVPELLREAAGKGGVLRTEPVLVP